jgi:hypothetical protein
MKRVKLPTLVEWCHQCPYMHVRSLTDTETACGVAYPAIQKAVQDFGPGVPIIIEGCVMMFRSHHSTGDHVVVYKRDQPMNADWEIPPSCPLEDA